MKSKVSTNMHTMHFCVFLNLLYTFASFIVTEGYVIPEICQSSETNCSTRNHGRPEDAACRKEHGACNWSTYEDIRLRPLRSSGCRDFCQCEYASTEADGSVTYRWAKHSCPATTLFDEEPQVCNHAFLVRCRGNDGGDADCQREHGVCRHYAHDHDRLFALKSSECTDFCHCEPASTQPDGSVTYKWAKHDCPARTLFDDRLKVCNHAYLVECTDYETTTKTTRKPIFTTEYETTTKTTRKPIFTTEYETTTKTTRKPISTTDISTEESTDKDSLSEELPTDEESTETDSSSEESTSDEDSKEKDSSSKESTTDEDSKETDSSSKDSKSSKEKDSSSKKSKHSKEKDSSSKKSKDSKEKDSSSKKSKHSKEKDSSSKDSKHSKEKDSSSKKSKHSKEKDSSSKESKHSKEKHSSSKESKHSKEEDSSSKESKHSKEKDSSSKKSKHSKDKDSSSKESKRDEESRELDSSSLESTNGEGYECYKCNNENSNHACNHKTEVCKHNVQSCETIVEWRDERYRVRKGCKNPTVSGLNAKLGCTRTGSSKIFCRFECRTNLCNEPLLPGL